MYEINCFDENGNSINYLTQWDTNQTLYIPIDGYDLSTAVTPEVHFCNKNSEEAKRVVVKKTINNTIQVSVPNDLLQESYHITGHIYLGKTIEEVVSQKTVITFTMPVRARKKPSDYYYIDNTSVESLADIEDRVCRKVIETLELPEVSAKDNGGFLQVVDGKWAVTTIAYAEENEF